MGYRYYRVSDEAWEKASAITRQEFEQMEGDLLVEATGIDGQDIHELLTLVGKAFLVELMAMGAHRVTTRMTSLKQLEMKLLTMKREQGEGEST